MAPAVFPWPTSCGPAQEGGMPAAGCTARRSPAPLPRHPAGVRMAFRPLAGGFKNPRRINALHDGIYSYRKWNAVGAAPYA